MQIYIALSDISTKSFKNVESFFYFFQKASVYNGFRRCKLYVIKYKKRENGEFIRYKI